MNADQMWDAALKAAERIHQDMQLEALPMSKADLCRALDTMQGAIRNLVLRLEEDAPLSKDDPALITARKLAQID